MLPKESIKEFQEIWHKIYGSDISDEEAAMRANNIFKFFDVLVRSPKKQESVPEINKNY